MKFLAFVIGSGAEGIGLIGDGLRWGADVLLKGGSRPAVW